MADIQFSSVTTGVTTGAGYFDVLMKSISAHIDLEYQQNRLKDTDYATVYLGAMQYAINTAERFVLAELITEAQIAATEADTAIKQAQSAKDLLVKDAQIASETAKQGLIVEQTQSEAKQNEVGGVIDKQIAHMVAQTATETNQALDVAKATAVKTQQIASMLVDDTVKASQKLLIDQQKLTEAQQTSKISYEVLTLLPSQNSLIVEQVATENSKQASMLADDGVKNSQKAMIDQQTLTEVQGTAKASYEVLTLLPSQNALITEQKETENAKQASMLVDDTVKQAQSTADLALKSSQTDNYVMQALNTAATTLTEGSKKLLVDRQTKGFDDDALQKLLKQSLDSWSVAYSVSTSANAIPDAIKVNPIDSIMKKAMDGLNVVNTVNPIGEL